MGIENIDEIDKRLHKIKVMDIMSRFAITTRQDTAIIELAHLLMRFKISGVPVISDNNEIIGIVTATDLFRIMKDIVWKIENEPEQKEGEILFVKDIMIKNVFSVTEDTSLFEVLKLMCDKNIHTLPVISGKEIVGVIGRRDIINTFYAKEC